MRISPEVLKVRLMKEAEKAIEELVSWGELEQEPTFSQIEKQVLGLRQRMSEQMSEALIEAQEAVKPEQKPICAGCEQEMEYKGMKRKQVSSWVGEVEVERGYYYCRACRAGFFPPG